MKITALDHLVLTVADIERTIGFYTHALGMTAIRFAGERRALAFGSQKINLHEAGKEFDPKALRPMPGSADLCFLVETPLEDIRRELLTLGIQIEEGPVQRTGATGPILSLYVRDPDGNLIELANRWLRPPDRLQSEFARPGT